MSDRDTDIARNALAGSKSPFLQHGAAQPVDWMPWGDEAFERAREENKPVLLDIGAVWCHWCHVMDAESYENEEIAKLINEFFVPIKVDRDERPDVDARYQRAVQVLTGQGGWPLTAFLTPDGEVYYGGTYFPPDDRLGRPSFPRVLREVARVWRDEPQRAREAAGGIRERLGEYRDAETRSGELTPALVGETLEELAQSFDFRYGGFGRAPKFPNAGALDLLLDEWVEKGTDWARRIVMETLDAMARGGIYDQLGGGFHRYSTDARWIVPHFEKMAYDNGALLETYARAFAVFGAPLHGRAATGIVEYYQDVAPELVATGGFPASQDADHSPHDDGDYWTWTAQEVQQALHDDDLYAVARLHYGIDDPGSAMHLDPSRRVLFQALDAAAIGQRLGLNADETSHRIAEVRRRLKAVRDQRPRPFLDLTLYSGWVALVASGHLAAARHLRHAGAASAALTALERLLADGFVAGRGVVHRAGDPKSGEFLEDHAWLAAALVDAFELTQDLRWLESAEAVLAVLLQRFRDPKTGACFDRPLEERAAVNALGQPYMPITDAPAPSGNGVAALTLLRTAALTGVQRYRHGAHAILRAFAGSAARLTTGAATYMKALAWATNSVTNVVVVDDRSAAESELFDVAIRRYRPRTVVRLVAPGVTTGSEVPPELQAMITAASPRAYLCAGQTCAAPVDEPDALDALLRDFRG